MKGCKRKAKQAGVTRWELSETGQACDGSWPLACDSRAPLLSSCSSRRVTVLFGCTQCSPRVAVPSKCLHSRESRRAMGEPHVLFLTCSSSVQECLAVCWEWRKVSCIHGHCSFLGPFCPAFPQTVLSRTPRLLRFCLRRELAPVHWEGVENQFGLKDLV